MAILDQLKNQLTQSSKLNAESPGGKELIPLIQSTLGTAELVFSNPDISEIGKGSPLIPGFDNSPSFFVSTTLALFPYQGKNASIFKIHLLFLEIENALQLSLTLEPTDSKWQLSSSFQPLAYSFFNQLIFAETPRFTLSSFEYTNDKNEQIQKGLNFSATLQLDGVLGIVLALFKKQGNQLKVNGSIEQNEGMVAINLRGDLSNELPSIPGLEQLVHFDDPTFYLLADPIDEKSCACKVEIQGKINLGQNNPLIIPIAIDVPAGSVWGWSLRLVNTPDHPGIVLQDLLGLFVPDQGKIELPESLAKLSKTSLTTLFVSFDPTGNASTTLDLALSVPGPWEAVEGYFGIKDMLFGLNITRKAEGVLWHGSIRGIVEMGIKFPLVLQVVPGGVWTFAISPYEKDPKPSLSDLVKVIGGNDLVDHLPPGISGSKMLELENFSLQFKPSDPANKIKQVELDVEIVKNLDVLPGFLALKEVRANLSISNPLDAKQRQVYGRVTGDIVIGKDTTLFLEATLPDKIITASIPDLNLTDLIEQFLPDSAAILDQMPALHFQNIIIELDAQNRSYSISGRTADTWSIVEGHLELNNISLKLQHTGGEQPDTSIELSGDIIIEEIPFYVDVVHAGADQGWQLSGWLDGKPIPLTDLMEKMLHIEKNSVPPSVPNIDIEVLSVSYDTASKAFSFEEYTSITWDKTIAGIFIQEIDLSVKIDSEVETNKSNAPTNNNSANPQAGTRVYTGYFEGDLKFDNDLSLILRYDFTPKNKSLRLEYDGYSCTITADDQKTTFKLQLGYLKLGELIEYAVNKVAPELHFKLEAPWNILNDIDLHSLTLSLEISKTDSSKTAKVEYLVNKNFAFVQIDSIGLSFPIGATNKKGIDFQFSGSVAGISYPATRPLKWDLLNEKPPAPGKDSSLFDLRYLALGQHVALKDAAQYTKVEALMDALETSAKPVDPSQGKIMSQLPALEYRADSNWFIGADLTVIDAVTLSMIFNDPELYGLLVSLKGPKVKIFDGLKFEILYKKINDEIGEYYAELKLPDLMRHLEFGAISLTLPIVGVAIYTNGNFQIDFGFPWKNDFSRSMGIQLFPFVGAGGFYFGVLSGATASQVPRIVNGTWAPVIAFGLGLKIGVGKEINEGIFTASLSLVVQGVLEGAFAVFNPNNPALPTDQFFKIQGAVGLVGQVEGAINFAILRAQISLKIYAGARLVAESHQPILLGLDVGIDFSMMVEILMIQIHFQFKADISVNFSIGQASPTPWILAPATTLPPVESNPRTLRWDSATNDLYSRGIRRRVDLLPHELMSPDFGTAPMALTTLNPAYTAPASKTPTLNWASAAASSYLSTLEDLELWFVPAYTLLDPNKTPGVQKVALVAKLFIENSISTASEKPYDRLVKTLFAWVLKSYIPAGLGDLNEVNSPQHRISFDILNDIYSALCKEYLPDYKSIVQVLNANFNTLKIKAGDSLKETTTATVFPMLPEATLNAGTLTVDFNTYNQYCDTDYIQLLNQYLDQLHITTADGALNEPAINGKESFATLLFNDYFGLILKGVVQAAQKLLQSFPYTVQAGSVEDQLKQFGVSFDPVEGYKHSPSFQHLVYANQDIAILPGVNLMLHQVHFPIREGVQSLQSIAEAFIASDDQTNFIQQSIEKNLFESTVLQPTVALQVPHLEFTLPDNSHAAIQKRFGVNESNIKLLNKIEEEKSNNSTNSEELYASGATLEISEAVFTVNAQTPSLNTINKISHFYFVRPESLVLANTEPGGQNKLDNFQYDSSLPEGLTLKLPPIHYQVPPFEKEMVAVYFGVALSQLNIGVV